MKWLRTLDEQLEAWLLVGLLANIVFWIAFQVIMRYVFSNSLSWSEEFVRWCFVWFIWIGVSYGFKERKHISVTALIDILPIKAKQIITLVVNAVVLWFMVKMFFYGWDQITSKIIARQSSIVLYWPFSDIRVSMQWLYASMPVGALFSAYRLAQNLITDIKAFKSDAPVAQTEGV